MIVIRIKNSMSDKFLNKYRIQSARLQGYDYGQNGAYFITICTNNREHFFGEISDFAMIFNEIGRLAEQFWMEIPNHFPFAALGNFVVMPDHVHGILIIDKTDIVTVDAGVDAGVDAETRLIASLHQPPTASKKTGGFAGNKNPMMNENISRIIRWYKGRCTFEKSKMNAGFAWQTRFHDHIIRNDAEFEKIQHYIGNNPLYWKEKKIHE